MSDPTVIIERLGPVLEITLNRPPANAISRATSREVYAALRQLQQDPELRVGVITGAGDRIFRLAGISRKWQHPGLTQGSIPTQC